MDFCYQPAKSCYQGNFLTPGTPCAAREVPVLISAEDAQVAEDVNGDAVCLADICVILEVRGAGGGHAARATSPTPPTTSSPTWSTAPGTPVMSPTVPTPATSRAATTDDGAEQQLGHDLAGSGLAEEGGAGEILQHASLGSDGGGVGLPVGADIRTGTSIPRIPSAAARSRPSSTVSPPAIPAARATSPTPPTTSSPT